MKRKIIIILLVVLVVIAGLIFSIRPVEKFSEDTVETVSLKEILQKELLDSIAGMIINSSKELQFELSEEDINRLIAGKADSKLKNMNIDSIHCIIHNGQAYFYADLKVLSLIPTQLFIKTNLTVEDNELKVAVEKAYVGRVPISKSFVLGVFQEKYDRWAIDSSSSTISIPIDLPKSLSIKELEVSDRIYFKLNISIKSAGDLLELLEYFGEKILN
ncbi:MAG: hypothetical protein K0S04_3117 [Herbinix sp.]|jgi:uncharacterized protein YpmS|nr:hypothetical protein [Herbinix sp.]